MYNDSSKVWYKSLTVWFNILLAVVSFVQTLSGIVPIPAKFIADIALLGNFLLRFKTDTSLTLSSKK